MVCATEITFERSVFVLVIATGTTIIFISEFLDAVTPSFVKTKFFVFNAFEKTSDTNGSFL